MPPADYIRTHGIPELAAAADAGKITVTQGARIAHAPKDQQAALLKAALTPKQRKAHIGTGRQGPEVFSKIP